MKYIKRLLNFIGYSLYNKKKYNIDKIAYDYTLEDTPHITSITPTNKKKLKKFYTILKIIYNILIFSILSWSIIYMFINYNSTYIYKIIFQIFIIIQYILGILYCNNTNINKKIDKKFKIINNLIQPSLLIIILAIIITISICIGTIYLLLNDYIYIYSELYKSQTEIPNIKIILLLFVTLLYTYLSFFINICIFIINMIYHRAKILSFKQNLLEITESTISSFQKINIIAIQFAQLRDEYSKTISELNLFFSTLNVFGIIYIYIIIQINEISDIQYNEWINIGTILLVEIIYILSAQQLKTIILETKELINKPLLNIYNPQNMFDRKIPQITENVTNKNISDICILSYITIVEISELTTLNSIDKTINKEWESFNIFGLIEITDVTIFQKIIGIVFILLMIKNLPTAL